MSVDRLSALPDSILCYILSFLETKDASITCLLSKRWQFLWTELPVLRFRGDYVRDMEDIRKFVNRVHRTLVNCRRDNLENFDVNFSHYCENCFALDVNVWIRFAVENKVKIFNLLLPGLGSHVLPQMMYSNPSWTSLSLRGCVMAPRRTIQWHSLTTLYIRHVELNDVTLQKIFSGCTLLSSLDMAFCWGFNLLDVNSPSLHRLAVILRDGCDLKISAPSIHTFKICLLSKYPKFYFENIKSLVRAEFDFYVDSECQSEWDVITLGRRSIEQFFGSIGHVRMLEVGSSCIELLSLILPDWQLALSMRGCLELHTFCENKSILGVLGLLEFSPNLETLVIQVDGSNYGDDVPEYDLHCDLFNLRTVYFDYSTNRNAETGEPMLTLARILLKRAVVLEKMVIDLRGLTRYSRTTSGTLFEMAQKLLGYPRFSHKAVVCFH